MILEDKAGFFKLWLTIGQRLIFIWTRTAGLDLPFLYILLSGVCGLTANHIKRACLALLTMRSAETT